MTNFCVEKNNVVIFSGWAPGPTGVIHRPESKISQNVFKFMRSTFLSRGFSAFLTTGTVLKSLQNDSPEPGDELKKIPSKNIFSSWRKMILKIFIFEKKRFLKIFEKSLLKIFFS